MTKNFYEIPLFNILYNIMVKRSAKIMVSVIIVVSIILFGGAHIIKNASASNIQKTKKVTSIQIESGETLWDIADKYADETEYKDYNEYIDEVKNINGISSDTIHAGAYLIVPYYE